MPPIQADMSELQRQLRRGSIQKAYKGLLDYMLDLRTHFKDKYPKYSVSGLYQGYLDMTYFAVVPPSLKRRRLKIAIVFNYGAFRFEAWLAAANRQLQQRVWELFRDTRWAEYRVVTPAAGVDSIVECGLAEHFDFGDLTALTATVDRKVSKFAGDMDRFLTHRETKSRG